MFYPILGSLGYLGVIAIGLLLMIALILLFRWIFIRQGDKIVAAGVKADYLDKKHYEVDLTKYRLMFSLMGLTLSLTLVLCAFEMPTYEEVELLDLGSLDAEADEIIEIPPTIQKPPPPPKIQQPEIIEVPDEKEIEEEIEVDLDIEVDEETIVEEIVTTEEPVEEEPVDKIFEIVEEEATPQGGLEAFYRYLGKNIEYPRQAKRMGVSGRVYIRFVVNKDGSLTDMEVIRGIGAGCDEEALRVLKGAPKWKPAKQRGRPVRQRMVIPVKFTLN